jgi:hypothetical protein
MHGTNQHTSEKGGVYNVNSSKGGNRAAYLASRIKREAEKNPRARDVLDRTDLSELHAGGMKLGIGSNNKDHLLRRIARQALSRAIHNALSSRR